MDISIIITFYNQEKYIRRCVDGILMTTPKECSYELVLVDDGSKDGTPAICDEYAAAYPNVRVVHKKNGGVSSARNAGMDAARGDWITFVDGDDYLEAGSVLVLEKMLERYGDRAEIIYYDGYGEHEGRVEPNKFFLQEDVNYGEPDNRDLVMASAISLGWLPKGNFGWFSLGGTACKLIRRSFAVESGVRYDENVTFAEDTLFSINLLDKSTEIYYFEAYLYHYVMENTGITRRYRKGFSEEIDVFIGRLTGFISEHNRRILRHALCMRAFFEVTRCIRFEFYHADSPYPFWEKHRRTRAFVRREPYRKAVITQIFDRESYPSRRCTALMILFGFYGLYALAYRTKNRSW